MCVLSTRKDTEEDRKPGGKTRRVEEIWKVCFMEDALDRTKWKNYLQNHSGDPR